MNDLLSVITSDLAIVIYLSIAVIVALFFVIKYTKKIKSYKSQAESDAVKNREDNLCKVLTNEKRGDK